MWVRMRVRGISKIHEKSSVNIMEEIVKCNA